MITREEAWKKFCEWTDSDALRKHARAVEIVMREAAMKYGKGKKDVEEWGIAGLLHDADYDRWPEHHPKIIVEWLNEMGEEKLAHAISAHHTSWGQSYDNKLDKALLACDEITGFIGACCFVRPDGIHSLKAKSVRKKLKDKSFAAKVDRNEIQAGIDMLDVDLKDHIEFIINALRPHAEELGLDGTGEKK